MPTVCFWVRKLSSVLIALPYFFAVKCWMSACSNNSCAWQMIFLNHVHVIIKLPWKFLGCPDNCLTCLDDQVCDQCDSLTYLWRGTCVQVCGQGLVPDYEDRICYGEFHFWSQKKQNCRYERLLPVSTTLFCMPKHIGLGLRRSLKFHCWWQEKGVLYEQHFYLCTVSSRSAP